MIPQVILSLTPDGSLALELPGPHGIRRKVELGREPLDTIMRVLRDQQRQELATIGLDAAPTQAQVLHWERHPIWRDPTCRFCQDELRREASRQQRAKRAKAPVIKLGDGVEVRRVPVKARAPGTRKAKQSLEELGL